LTVTEPVSSSAKRNDAAHMSDYKWGDRTYDDVLNVLMDRVPLEDISREQVREHYRRLKTFEGVSREEFKAKVKVRRPSGS